MPERATIKITPSVSDANLLTVVEAMRQVLDFVALLDSAEKSMNDDGEKIIWKLADATMNSPFALTLEAHAVDPASDIDDKAVRVKKVFQRGMDAVFTGKEIPSWMKKKDGRENLHNFLKRNMNGIGCTDLDLGNTIPPVSVSHRTADQAMAYIRKREDFTHSAYGTLEGTISRTETYYSKPSFFISERLTRREIRCNIVRLDLADKIGEEHRWSEVWNSKRVSVEGNIHYNADGDPDNVDIVDIKVIDAKQILADQFLDPNFTNGLRPSEYLDRLREGRNG